MMNILMKLEMLSSMYKAYGEVYLNNVIIKENCTESIICYLKKLTLLIEAVANVTEKCTYSDILMFIRAMSDILH